MFRSLSPTQVGRWSARRPWRAIGLWLAFVTLAVALVSLTGTKQLHNGAVGDSARGYTVMDAHRLGFAPREYAYLRSGTMTAGQPTFRGAVAAVSARMHAVLDGPVRTLVSPDRRAVIVSAAVQRPFSQAQLTAAVGAIGRAHPALNATLIAPPQGGGGSDLSRAEKLSIPVTLAVLLIAFGALVAALVPVLLAATAVIAAFGLLGPISQVFPLDSSVKTVVLLIGMAVGVDYALFYVVRSREERRRGLGTRAALERTAATAGRSVLIAGSTVAIAMAGQFAIGSPVFDGIASGTIAVVLCAVAGSVTVLPALLQLLGPRIDRGTVPFAPRLRTDGDSRFWSGLVDCVLRRPVLAALLSAGVLVALAVPALGLRTAKPSSSALSAGGQSSAAAQILADFPSLSSSALVVSTWPASSTAQVRPALARLEALATHAGLGHPPYDVTAGLDRTSLVLALPLTGLGANPASRGAVRRLRGSLIPRTLGRVPGTRTYVTGDSAEDVDFTTQMNAGIPFVVAFVLVLAFLLLLVTFRSLVVPIKAIALNLLSVSASYGVLVLVFQHGWAQGLLGFRSDGTIISWLPLFLFVVLFGLSMDYHVFILSRVREGVDAGMSTERALRHGITRTAGVVSSAALVMVGVFSLFITSSSLDLKQAGVGLAVAVALDATLIRGVLLPATMALLGERNWYLPRWLAWLPRLGGHAHAQPLPAPVPSAAAAIAQAPAR